MVRVEQGVSSRSETLKAPGERIVILSPDPGDKFTQVADGLKPHFMQECGGEVDIDLEIDVRRLKKAINGIERDGSRKQRATTVVVGQTFEQYHGKDVKSVLDIDESRYINHIREVCREQHVALGRYRKKPNGTFEFLPDR